MQVEVLLPWSRYSQDVAALRALLPPSKTIIAGDYVLYDLPDWEDPQSFYSIMNQSVQLYLLHTHTCNTYMDASHKLTYKWYIYIVWSRYERGEIEGSFLFAGVWFTAQYLLRLKRMQLHQSSYCAIRQNSSQNDAQMSAGFNQCCAEQVYEPQLLG